MSWVDRYLIHALVYWAAPTPDGTGGYTYDTPVEITGRWVDKAERFQTSMGDTFVSRSIVHADQELEVGGVLWKGSLSSLSAEEITNPMLLAAAYAIRVYQSTPNVAGTITVRKAIL